MKEVTKEQFWEKINTSEKDIISSSVGNWPYTNVFKYRYSRAEVGRIVQKKTDGGYPIVSDYYLTE